MICISFSHFFNSAPRWSGRQSVDLRTVGKQVGIKWRMGAGHITRSSQNGICCDIFSNLQVLVREGGRLSLLSLDLDLDNREEKMVEQVVGEAGQVSIMVIMISWQGGQKGL